jgi:hypothetical protein
MLGVAIFKMSSLMTYEQWWRNKQMVSLVIYTSTELNRIKK